MTMLIFILSISSHNCVFRNYQRRDHLLLMLVRRALRQRVKESHENYKAVLGSLVVGQELNVIHGNVIEVAVDRQIAGIFVVGQANRAEESGVDHLSQGKIRNTNRNVLVVAIGYHHSGLILNSNRVAVGAEPVDLKEEEGVDLVDINIGSCNSCGRVGIKL